MRMFTRAKMSSITMGTVREEDKKKRIRKEEENKKKRMK